MKRRAFFGTLFAGMTLASASSARVAARAGGIPTRPFGRTGQELTVIGLGGARLALLRTKAAAREHVRRALDLGINYFDCAHSYWEGHSEEVYGDVLSDVRQQVFITSKSTQRTSEAAMKELDLTLKRLKSDYVDLWQIHGVGTSDEVRQILGPGGAIEAFEGARQKGKCRYIGFTGHADPQVLLELLKAYDRFDSALMPLHAADHFYKSFERNLLPAVKEKGLAVQGMKVFGNAFLLRALNPRECLHFALSLPVDCLPVGCSTQGQLEDDVRFAQSFVPLGEDEMGELRKRALEGVGVVKGAELEYWKNS